MASTAPAGVDVPGTAPESDATPAVQVHADDHADDHADHHAGSRPQSRRRGGRILDVLAVLVVLAALVAPDQLGLFMPAAFFRIPVEGLVVVVAALLLHGRLRTVLLVVAGLLLGLLTVLRVLDIGFDAVLVRPFDPVLDWVLVADGIEFVRSVAGRPGEVAVVVLAVAAAAALVILVTRALLRTGGLAARQPRRATGVVAVLTVAWLGFAASGTQDRPELPVAAHGVADSVRDHVVAVRDGVRDERTFARRAAADRFAAVPGDRLLTGLRGKDVVLAFVESYGRTAVEDPAVAPQVAPALTDGERRLRAAGFAARSGWLTSSTAGGGSWFAHATLLSGMWSHNLATFRPLVSSRRLTLNGAFEKAGWETVALMPGVTRAWPEATFYGYDRLYDSGHLGYRGPSFAWSPMPDQYALSTLQRDVLSVRDRRPVMVEAALTSSHAPWAPVPRSVPWDRVGDGSVYRGMSPLGADSSDVWPDQARVRGAYAQSLRYSLGTLFSWLQTYGDDDLVLVFLGDHQPVPVVTGPGASRDVPITIVAKDPAVLERVASWGWTEGLTPARTAPVWRMDAFRDRFLTAFG